MIKSFLQFINENHDDNDGHDDRSELADLESLYSLGMVDDAQYCSDAIRILKSMGVISSSEPIVSINIDSSFEGVEERETKVLSDLVRDWTGPYGERILELTMNLDDNDDGETRLLLDTGIDCTFIHSPSGDWWGTSAEISVADRIFTEHDILDNYVYDEEEDEEDTPFYPNYADQFESMLRPICKMYGKMAVDSILKKLKP